MKRLLLSRRVLLVVLVSIGLGSGCGQKSGGSLAPVTGKVTVDGKPLTGGSVSLIPDLPMGEEGAKQASKLTSSELSGGAIKSDGTYKIQTGGKDGAPLGKYKVRVIPPLTETKGAKETPDIGFDQENTDANKTKLKIEVVASPEAGRYDLKLKK
ncbi:MAG TPA: hypothetical protein VH592_24885 [Gemmataceae bacterium]|jgi:hypothetical protein